MKVYTVLIPADKVKGTLDWTKKKKLSAGSLYAWTQ